MNGSILKFRELQYLEDCLGHHNDFTLKPTAKVVWIGGTPIASTFTKSKKGTSWEMMQLTFHEKTQTFDISLEKEVGEWLLKTLNLIAVSNDKLLTIAQLKESFEVEFDDFELFWFSKPVDKLKQFGLLVL